MGLINTRNPIDPRTLEFSWKLPVLSSIATPPVSPVNGARHRIIATATGVWLGKENKIAIWDSDNSAWYYETYGEGSIVYDLNAHDYRYVLQNGTWQQFDKIPLAISDVTGLQTALDEKADLEHASNHALGGDDEITGELNATALIRIRKDDANEITNKIINLIEGTNIEITTVDNGDNIDLTITSTASSLNEFSQDLFKIIGDADPTKKVSFDVDALLTTETEVVKKLQNSNGTLAELEGDQVFTALVQALTVIATDSLTTEKIVLTDSATDPTVNGEIQLNDTRIKFKAKDTVQELNVLPPSSSLKKETTEISEFSVPTFVSVSSNIVNHAGETVSGTTFSNLSATIDGDLANETCVMSGNGGFNGTVKIDRGSIKDGKFAVIVRNTQPSDTAVLKIETSDNDSSWTERVANTNIKNILTTITMPSVVAFRYVRLTVSIVSNPTSFTYIREFYDVLTSGFALVDDVETSFWESANEVGANFVVNYTTGKILGGIAIKPHANMTATQLKLELSNADSSYTRVATINVSDLTMGVYNFIRWNLLDFDVRYIKITALDGGSVIIAFYEIKYDTKTSLEVLAGAGHELIDPTDATLTKISTA